MLMNGSRKTAPRKLPPEIPFPRRKTAPEENCSPTPEKIAS